ncbi:pilus assembly protein TadG-related protein [Falsiroseomonas oryzae]|uniref:pilus assembly protein TadG-related protein n=1 Tax=Falsiroseomonas oryzae TaxID=2766473 RepID=UPI0022EB87BC|nr:pilus assembly protein TadG-related protein [Roseomonas sp. MO-31]
MQKGPGHLSLPSSCRSRRGVLARLVADRRGVTSYAVAAGLVTIFGAAAISTDVGSWYAARRAAQNAADASAAAAAVTLAFSTAEAARTTGRDVAARNGFTHAVGGPTTVTVNVPPTTGARTGDPSAVEVVVQQRQVLGASGFFLTAPPTVTGRSVATLRDARNVCLLALTGQVTAGGNATVTVPNCVMASNRRGGPGMDFGGGSYAITAYSMVTVADCQGCNGNARIALTEGAREWQPPIADPFAHLQSKVMPRPTNGCASVPNGRTVNLAPYESNGRRVLCGNIRVNGGDTLTLSPGTYYIHNGSLTVNGGGTVRCPSCVGGAGVAIVLTGDAASIGEVRLNGNSVIDLRAALTAADPDYNGILIYRDVRAPAGSTVRLNGGTTMSLVGGIYLPSSHVEVTGNAAAIACTVVVAASIDFRGTADVTDCNLVGTRVPQTRMVVVAE